jgi:DNA mismatch endonuclease (patch repair protein)
VIFEDVPALVRRRMARIRKTDTRPELMVRRLVRRLGFGYRLHRSDLPGTPDLTFSGRRKVIFVHGCFWHRHDCALGRKQPRSRQAYWGPKLDRNVARDAEHISVLSATGWQVLVVWECELRDEAAVTAALARFLGGPARPDLGSLRATGCLE